MPDEFQTFDPAADPPLLRSVRCARLLDYWNGLRGNRPFPSRDEIDPSLLKPILPHIMLVSLEYDPFRAFYRLVGTEIVRFAKFDFTGRYADALRFQNDETVDWTIFYRQVAEDRRPGLGLTYWTVSPELRRWIEFLICPLSSDGTTIDRCIALEDYEPLNLNEIDSLPPVEEQ